MYDASSAGTCRRERSRRSAGPEMPAPRTSTAQVRPSRALPPSPPPPCKRSRRTGSGSLQRFHGFWRESSSLFSDRYAGCFGSPSTREACASADAVAADTCGRSSSPSYWDWYEERTAAMRSTCCGRSRNTASDLASSLSSALSREAMLLSATVRSAISVHARARRASARAPLSTARRADSRRSTGSRFSASQIRGRTTPMSMVSSPAAADSSCAPGASSP